MFYYFKQTIMRKILYFFLMLCMSSVIHAQTAPAKKINPNKKVLVVEASCGECQFKMKGKGCTLAIKIDGKNYFVSNANIDDYGDAHEKKGFCNSIRKAKVQGEVVNGKFVVSYFELID
jgi:hypothetical protein